MDALPTTMLGHFISWCARGLLALGSCTAYIAWTGPTDVRESTAGMHCTEGRDVPCARLLLRARRIGRAQPHWHRHDAEPSMGPILFNRPHRASPLPVRMLLPLSLSGLAALRRRALLLHGAPSALLYNKASRALRIPCTYPRALLVTASHCASAFAGMGSCSRSQCKRRSTRPKRRPSMPLPRYFCRL